MNRGAAPWGPDGQPEQLISEEERRFTTSGEIAARLGVPRPAASQVLDRGQALLQPEFAATEAPFRSGLLDASKTSLVVRRLQDADTEVAAAVQERILPRAPRRTASQLSRDINRELAALEPGGVSSRRKRNVTRRHVARPREAGEGVHEMRLLLPNLDAFLLDATLDAIAASARAAGDQRTLSQLRADAITGMTLRTLQGSQHVACRNTADTDDADYDDTGGTAPGAAPADAATFGRAGLMPDGVPLTGAAGGAQWPGGAGPPLVDPHRHRPRVPATRNQRQRRCHRPVRRAVARRPRSRLQREKSARQARESRAHH